MSRQSQKRSQRAQSGVKSASGASFANSQKSGAMGSTAKSGQPGPNIIIDIESEQLTYNQARSIRLQLQRDVEQLRNRVRMLQNEENRAIKKIEETRKKTRELQELQNKNDTKVLQKQREEQQLRAKQEQDREALRRRREKEKTQVLIRNKNFKEQKLAAVEEVRRQKEAIKHNLYGMREQNYTEAQIKKQQIRSQKANGLAKQNDFIKQKRAMARQDVDTAAHQMTNQISNYEKESMELERLENELLRKLQETQVQERAAFQRLENAMVDGSIPPPMRAEQSIMNRSTDHVNSHADTNANQNTQVGEDGAQIGAE